MKDFCSGVIGCFSLVDTVKYAEMKCFFVFVDSGHIRAGALSCIDPFNA